MFWDSVSVQQGTAGMSDEELGSCPSVEVGDVRKPLKPIDSSQRPP